MEKIVQFYVLLASSRIKIQKKVQKFSEYFS